MLAPRFDMQRTRARARANAARAARPSRNSRVRYEERGVHLRAVLELRDPGTGQWRPVGDALVSYPNVQRTIALRNNRPDLLPENRPLRTEVGWFGSKFVRRVKRVAKKVARSKIGKVAKVVAGAYFSVQNITAKAMAKSGIPLASEAGKAYLRVVTPVTNKLLGKHAKPWELLAKNAERRLPAAASAAERAQLERVARVAKAKAVQGAKLAERVAARVASMPLERAKSASKKAVHRAVAAKVVLPSGNVFYVKP